MRVPSHPQAVQAVREQMKREEAELEEEEEKRTAEAKNVPTAGYGSQ